MAASTCVCQLMKLCQSSFKGKLKFKVLAKEGRVIEVTYEEVVEFEIKLLEAIF